MHAECSLSMLANIEQGAVPRKGYVVTRILRALDELENA
jgi:predicted transcriptional regulator